MPLKCCTLCVRESSTQTGIKLHRQNCSKYHEHIMMLRSLKQQAAEARISYREGTNTTSYHQRGEPETTQTVDTVSVVMFPGLTKHLHSRSCIATTSSFATSSATSSAASFATTSFTTASSPAASPAASSTSSFAASSTSSFAASTASSFVTNRPTIASPSATSAISGHHS